MKAILLVDHGSRKSEANEMLGSMEKLVQDAAGTDVIVRHAHMELAEPTIAQGFASCVEAGAREVIVFPYMLSPGRHSTSDIPRMVSEVAGNYPGVGFSVTPPFGIHDKLGEIILARAGIE
jgi:sirohydrochlorin ferrochelatase